MRPLLALVMKPKSELLMVLFGPPDWVWLKVLKNSAGRLVKDQLPMRCSSSRRNVLVWEPFGLPAEGQSLLLAELTWLCSGARCGKRGSRLKRSHTSTEKLGQFKPNGIGNTALSPDFELDERLTC